MSETKIRFADMRTRVGLGWRMTKPCCGNREVS